MPIHILEFSAEFQDIESSHVALLKTDSPTDALQTILKTIVKLAGNICGEVNF